jgi:hypothetical protein
VKTNIYFAQLFLEEEIMSQQSCRDKCGQIFLERSRPTDDNLALVQYMLDN